MIKNLFRLLGCCLIIGVFLNTIHAQPAPSYRIASSVIGAGGVQASSRIYKGLNTVGQPTPAGISQSSNFGLYAGFIPTTLEGLSLPSGQRGDVNGDGGVDVLDVLSTVNHILGIQVLIGDALLRADCNADGSINVLDALGIVNVILGVGECIPAVASTKTGVPAAHVWSPKDALLHKTAQDIESGSILEMPVWIDSENELAGLQLVVRFDPGILIPGEPELTNRSAGMRFSFHVDKGKLQIVLFSPENNVILAGEGPVVTIPFVSILHDNENIETVIQFEDVLLAASCTDIIPVETEPITLKTVPLPSTFALSQNYPNPFNPDTDIRYQIADIRSPLHTTLKIYNVLGQEVRTLVDEPKESGFHTVTWNGEDVSGSEVSSGVYFYRLSVDHGTWSETKRMVLMR